MRRLWQHSCKSRPKDSKVCYNLAHLLVANTNLEAYQQLCKAMVATFSNTTDILVADRIAKACLYMRSDGVDMNAVGAMANLAVTKGKESANFPWFVDTEALAQKGLNARSFKFSLFRI